MNVRKIAAAIAVAAGLIGVTAGTAAATASRPAAPAGTTAVVQHAKATPAEPKDGQEQSGETATAEVDGPGGHQDAPGQNVDHQFNGVE